MKRILPLLIVALLSGRVQRPGRARADAGGCCADERHGNACRHGGRTDRDGSTDLLCHTCPDCCPQRHRERSANGAAHEHGDCFG